jgi:hypothetical protein
MIIPGQEQYPAHLRIEHSDSPEVIHRKFLVQMELDRIRRDINFWESQTIRYQKELDSFKVELAIFPALIVVVTAIIIIAAT